VNKKIGVATYFNQAYLDLGKITSAVMLSYCQHHGYDFICCRDEDEFKGRTPLWSKIPILTNNLSNYDWLVWIDSDAMPVNFSYRLEDFIDEDYSIVLAHEHHSDHPEPCINTGIMFIKNCPESFELLAGTWAQEQCINAPWGEQQGLIELLEKKTELNSLIKRLEVKPINVKPQNFQQDDFIMHIAGGPSNPQYKARLANEFLPKIGFNGK
jgi:hypothetical protein